MNYRSKELLIKSEKKIPRDDLLHNIEEIQDLDGLIAIQLFNHHLILSTNQIRSAIWHAMQGYNSKKMISKELGLEILVFLSGQRQIVKALNNFGIPKAINIAGLIIVGENDDLRFDNNISFIEKSFNKYNLLLETFNPKFDSKKISSLAKAYELDIKDKELDEKGIEKLILSKIALLRTNTY